MSIQRTCVNQVEFAFPQSQVTLSSRYLIGQWKMENHVKEPQDSEFCMGGMINSRGL